MSRGKSLAFVTTREGRVGASSATTTPAGRWGSQLILPRRKGKPAEDGAKLPHELKDKRLGQGGAHGAKPELSREGDAEPALVKDNGVGVERKIKKELHDDNFNDKGIQAQVNTEQNHQNHRRGQRVDRQEQVERLEAQHVAAGPRRNARCPPYRET